jgi:hypothetical protein
MESFPERAPINLTSLDVYGASPAHEWPKYQVPFPFFTGKKF